MIPPPIDADITRVTNDSISIHICSDWSMRETIVSGVSCAPTAWPWPEALDLDKSWLDRAFYLGRWRAPRLHGVSISRIGHHAISSAIFRRACAFHPCGWPPSRGRFPAGWLSRRAPYGAERSPSSLRQCCLKLDGLFISELTSAYKSRVITSSIFCR